MYMFSCSLYHVDGRHITTTGRQTLLISQVRCVYSIKFPAIKTPTCAGLFTLTAVNYHVIMVRLLFLIMILSSQSFILSKYSFRPIHEKKCYCRAHQNNTRSVFVKYTRSVVFTAQFCIFNRVKNLVFQLVILIYTDTIFQWKFGEQNVELRGGISSQSQVRPRCLYFKRNRDEAGAIFH